MARKPKSVSVYERIEEKRLEINNAELVLAKLNEELQTLYAERDELQMRQLLQQMKDSNLDIQTALDLLTKNK